MGVRLMKHTVNMMGARNRQVFHNLTQVSIPGGLDSNTTKVKEIHYAPQARLLKEDNRQEHSSRSKKW